MKTLNRTIAILNFGILVVLAWTLIAHTEWAATRSILGVGTGWESPLEPFIQIGAGLLLTVSGTLLVKDAAARIKRLTDRQPATERIRIPGPATSTGGAGIRAKPAR